MRGLHHDAGAVRPTEPQGIGYRAAMNARRAEALRGESAPRRIDIVDHEIEGRFDAALWPPRRLRDNEMRAAAQLQHREILITRDRTQPDGFEPFGRCHDVARFEHDMADRDR